MRSWTQYVCYLRNLEVHVQYSLVLLVKICWTHGVLGCEEGNLRKLTLLSMQQRK